MRLVKRLAIWAALLTAVSIFGFAFLLARDTLVATDRILLQHYAKASFLVTNNDTRIFGNNHSSASGTDQGGEGQFRGVSVDNTLIFNCQNIPDIHIQKKVGNGISKNGFVGLHEGRQVMIRMTSLDRADSSDCLFAPVDDGIHFLKTKECLRPSQVKVMKEIVMLQQLNNHPGIIKMLGYCVRSQEATSTSLKEHGCIIVTEYGQVLTSAMVESWNLRERLLRAVEIMDLFLYLEHSPIGSIEYPDFKLWHFVIHEDRIKAIDFDDASSLEPLCPNKTTHPNENCIFNLPCQEDRCLGYNAKMNMWRFDSTFNQLLFPEEYFEQIPKLQTISSRLKEHTVDALELKTMIKNTLSDMPENM